MCRCSTVLVATLGALASSCEHRVVPGQPDLAAGDGAHPADQRVRDVRPADQRITLPWVSTYAGTSCGMYRNGHRLEASLGMVGAIAIGPLGRLYLYSGILSVIDNDWVSPLTPLSNGDDIAVEANYVIDLADNWRIRQYRDGELKTLAGSVEGHRDGPAADALFNRAMAIKAASDRSLIIGDGIYLRQLRDGMVTTIAGREHPLPFLGPQDGPPQEAVLLRVTAVAIAPQGIYFADGVLVRSLIGGEVKTIAGQYYPYHGAPGFQDGPVDEARFSKSVSSIAWHQGTLYLADNGRIRQIAGGVVSSLTNSKVGLKDGPLAEAEFDHPRSIAVDDKGNLYVADSGNCRIRYIQLH